MNNRIEYFDFLRGIAILMVVGIHTFPPTNFDTYNGNISIIIRQMLNCAVPIFLAISGYFIGKRGLTNTEWLIFLKHQIPKIYIPYFLWSLPLFILALYQSSGSVLANIARLLLCGFSVYYFIALIIQYYLLTPILKSLVNMRGGGYMWPDLFLRFPS